MTKKKKDLTKRAKPTKRAGPVRKRPQLIRGPVGDPLEGRWIVTEDFEEAKRFACWYLEGSDRKVKHFESGKLGMVMFFDQGTLIGWIENRGETRFWAVRLLTRSDQTV